MADVHFSNPVDKLHLTVGSLPLVLDTSGTYLQVFTKGVQGRLDPQAAEVIVALGGEEPPWLRPVESLMCVHRHFPGDEAALVSAAEAIGAKEARRAQIARQSESDPVLIGLAAFGQKQVATNPCLDARMWTLLRYHRISEVSRQALDIANVLPPRLALFPDPETRMRVANNPECPPGMLAMLSLDSSSEQIRVAAARNTACPQDALGQLSRDENVGVRHAVAANASTNQKLLARLLVDRYAHVRVAAVTNPSLPPKAAARRIGIDATPTVHIALASRVDLSPRALSWLERYSRGDKQHTYAAVRRRLRQNPTCPDYLMKRLDYIDRRISASRPRKEVRLDFILGVPVAICGLPFVALLILAAVGDAQTGNTLGCLIRGGCAVAVGWLTVYVVRRLWRLHAPPTGAYFVPPRRRQAMALVALCGFALPIFVAAGLAVGGVDAGPVVPVAWAVWVTVIIVQNRLNRRRWPRPERPK
jgi:hypothetical protein